MAREIFDQSSAWSWPLRTRVESTRASRAQQPLGQLEVAHLQREEQHRPGRLERGVGDHAERERRVVHEHVAGHEVVQLGDGEVVDLLVAVGLDGHDLVPPHVARRHGRRRPRARPPAPRPTSTGSATARAWATSSSSAACWPSTPISCDQAEQVVGAGDLQLVADPRLVVGRDDRRPDRGVDAEAQEQVLEVADEAGARRREQHAAAARGAGRDPGGRADGEHAVEERGQLVAGQAVDGLGHPAQCSGRSAMRWRWARRSTAGQASTSYCGVSRSSERSMTSIAARVAELAEVEGHDGVGAAQHRPVVVAAAPSPTR